MDQQQSAMLAVVLIVLPTVWVLWRTKRPGVRRILSAAVGLIAAVAGYVATMAYAIPALRDFRSAGVSLPTAVLDNLVIWALAIGAFFMAFRFLLSAIRRPKSR